MNPGTDPPAGPGASPTGAGRSPAGPAAAGSRALLLASAGCALGGGLAFYAASRGWVEVVLPRPEPLGPELSVRTGTSAVTWLPAAALVALGGAGGLIASRGRARPVIGLLLVLSGVALTVGTALAWWRLSGSSQSPAGRAGASGSGWPALLCVAAGLLVTGCGVLAVGRGASWPVLGARYERGDRGGSGRTPEPAAPGTSDRGPGQGLEAGPISAAQIWDAIDRGEDPTDR